MPPVMCVSGPGQPMQVSPPGPEAATPHTPLPLSAPMETCSSQPEGAAFIPPPNPLLKPKVPCLSDTKRWEVLSQNVAL